MRRLSRVAGSLTVLIGVVHLGVAPLAYDWPNFEMLWFVGSGIAVLLIGTLTVLSSSEHAWRSLAATALAANLGGLALALAFGVLTRWREPQGPVLAALFIAGILGCIHGVRRN